MLYPATPVLAFHDKLTLYCGVAPVPVRDSTTVGVTALLWKDSDPETVPIAVGAKRTLNDLLWPAGIVKGKETPLTTKCELLLASDDTVTEAPLALMVTACVSVEPTFTLPKFTLDGVMLNWPAVVVVPLPLKNTLTPESDALLFKCADPVTGPLPVGLKATLNVILWPAGIVNGTDAGPLTTNSPLLLKSEATVTLAPVADIVKDLVTVDPTLTLPKFSVQGDTLKCPLVFVVVPVPLSGMFKPSFETKMSPVLIPADEGVNFALTVTLCPELNVNGSAGPETENPPPVACHP